MAKEIRINDAYEIIEERKLSHIDGEGYFLKHKKSGTRLVLLACPDKDKVFEACFLTPPENDKGITHILEHSLLSGSDKYPLKDPFLELDKSSLATFLNAMTLPDRTEFPVASCNLMDFKNLMDIYLDCIFHPNLAKNRFIFMQEGWHLENDGENVSANGIVYNEMKGSLSSAETKLFHKTQRNMYDGTSYMYTSGGEPFHVIDLSYEELMEYYYKYYVPENCIMCLYGDMDMEERLSYLDREYLSKWDRHGKKAEYKSVTGKGLFKSLDYYSSSGEGTTNDKTYISYSFLLPERHDPLFNMTMSVLDYALFSNPAGDLFLALVNKDKLGRDFYTSFSYNRKQPMYSMILCNSEPDRDEKFISLVNSVLKNTVKNGIDKKALRAAINVYEFAYRENIGGDNPKGMNYFSRIMDSIIFDGENIFNSVDLEDIFEELKTNLTTGYYEEFIDKYLTNAGRKTIDVLIPKEGVGLKEENDINHKLEEKWSGLSEDERDDYKNTLENYLKWQETPDHEEVLNKFPILSRSDLTLTEDTYRNEYIKAKVPVYFHEDTTNGIAYITLSFDLTGFTKDELKYAAFLTDLFAKVDITHDSKNISWRELPDIIDLLCGSMYGTVSIYNGLELKDKVTPTYEVRAKCLTENIGETLSLINDILLHSDFSDNERLSDRLTSVDTAMTEKLEESKGKIAENEAYRTLSSFEELRSLINGLSFAEFINKMAGVCGKNSENITDLSEQLQSTLKKILLCPAVISLTGSRKELQELIASENKFEFENEAGAEFGKRTFDGYKPANLPMKRTRIADTNVSYVACVMDFGKNDDIKAGTLDVLAQILYSDYFWQNIRVKGGAYGCSVGIDDGRFLSILSNRDPDINNTLSAINNLADYVDNFTCSDRQMLEYTIGAFSYFEQPETARERGNRFFRSILTGDSKERQEAIRKGIVTTTLDDIRAVAKYIRKGAKKPSIVICTNKMLF